MRKKLSLLMVALVSIAAIAGLRRGAEPEVVTYALAEGDTFTSGQTVDVKNGEETVATITYGFSGGDDFNAAAAEATLAEQGFAAFTAGNGVNGTENSGTCYIITPKFAGSIDVAVVLNNNKPFFITEDGTALEDYNGFKVDAKYYGTYSFQVKANSVYKVYCTGSKLGFYGFKYTYTAQEAEEQPTDDGWVKTAPADLATGDVVVIVDLTTVKAMANDGGTSAAPTATAVTLSEDKSQITSDVASNLQWVVNVEEGKFKFNVAGTQNYLYCINNNNGVRVGNGDNNVFSLETVAENFFLLNDGQSRNVGVYNNQDWRSYQKSGENIHNNIKNTVTTFYKKTQVPVAVARPTFSVEPGAYTSAQSVELSALPADAKIYYTLDGTEPTASSTPYEAAISVTATTTIKAIAIKGEDKSKIATAEYTILESIANTEATAYTVAEAIEMISGETAKSAEVLAHKDNKVFVKGIVSKVGTFNETYKSLTYWISADGTEENQIQVYGGKGLAGADFASADDVKVGASVIVKGNLKKFNTTNEIDTNNELVKYTGPVKDVEIAAADITDGDITAAIASVTTGYTVGKLTINLAENGAYTITKSIVASSNVTINGNGATVAMGAEFTGDVVTLNGTTAMVKKADESFDASHHYIASVEISGVKISGIKGSLIKDAQKTLLEKLTINNSVIEMAANKQVINFQSQGYVGEVIVKNSTVYSSLAKHEQFFAQYGSRPKNIDGSWLQQFDVENSTLVNIAVGKNFCDFSQNGTAQNVYTLKNNVFVDCGKEGQTIVGFNKGGVSAAPAWTVDGNAINWGGKDKSAAEVEKAGKKEETDIVKNTVAGVITFTDAAAGDFNAELGVALAPASETPTVAVGDPRWTITAKQVPVDIVISPADGDIAAALATASEGKIVKNITINLTKDVVYTLSTPITIASNFAINGNGATINAAGFTGNAIVAMAASAEAPTEITKIDNITFSGLTIKGLKTALFYSSQKKYDIAQFNITNSIIEQAGDATTIDFTKGSAARNINVTGSTIYAPTATTKSFYSSQAGEKMTEIDADGIQTFTFKNNTMFNLAKTKNFFSHRQNSQKWLAYDVENNIFVNCGKSGQVIIGMNGGGQSANPTWTIIGNVFNFDGADTSTKEETGDSDHTGDATPGLNETVQNSIAGVVTFTDAAAGDFAGNVEQPYGTTAPETKPGDPRWALTFTNAPQKFAITVAETTNGTATVDKAEAAEGEAVIITVTPAEGYELDAITGVTATAVEGEANKYQFTMGAEAVTVTVTFKPATGISNIAAEKLENQTIYNLRGQRVEKAQKGLYIVNGRKVVIK